jgi:ribosomal protein L11 methyltransferase
MEKTPTSHPAFPGPQPVPVARRFLLCPEGASPHDGSPFGEERIPIILGRGKAFGSGFHETTASCLEALENLALTEKSAVLDVGTGTGILSMAALLLGARYAVAVDMDKEAAVTCRRNMELNGLEKRAGVSQGTLEALDPTARFDLVLANIHGDIILQEARRLAGHTRSEGHLVLSGLDYSDNRPVRETMINFGMKEVSIHFLEEFVTQVWHRPPRVPQTEP